MAVDPERNPLHRMYEAFARLQTASDTGPRTVIHGDVHIGNAYQVPDDFGLLDWQLMRVATWANDVSYPILTALDVEERRASERELLRHYLAELTARGVAGTELGRCVAELPPAGAVGRDHVDDNSDRDVQPCAARCPHPSGRHGRRRPRHVRRPGPVSTDDVTGKIVAAAFRPEASTVSGAL